MAYLPKIIKIGNVSYKSAAKCNVLPAKLVIEIE